MRRCHAAIMLALAAAVIPTGAAQALEPHVRDGWILASEVYGLAARARSTFLLRRTSSSSAVVPRGGALLRSWSNSSPQPNGSSQGY